MSNAWNNFWNGVTKTASAASSGDATGAAAAAAETATSTAQGVAQDAAGAVQDAVDALDEATEAAGAAAASAVDRAGHVVSGASDDLETRLETATPVVVTFLADTLGLGSIADTAGATLTDVIGKPASSPPPPPESAPAARASSAPEEVAVAKQLLAGEVVQLRYDFEAQRAERAGRIGDEDDAVVALHERGVLLARVDAELSRRQHLDQTGTRSSPSHDRDAAGSQFGAQVEATVVELTRLADEMGALADEAVHLDPAEVLGRMGTLDDSALQVRDARSALLDTLVDPATELPADARVWENRSGVEGSGYEAMAGPSIAFADDVWYFLAEDPGVGWVAFHEGPMLDWSQISAPVPTEALEFEVLSGTSLFGAARPSELGLTLDGASGHLLTPGGTLIDPTELEYVRAADGTVAVVDLAADTWWVFGDIDTPLASPPPPPYVALAAGPGTPPPLDALDPGHGTVFDAAAGRYHDAASGAVIGFHQSELDQVRRWDNRSGHEDAGYDNMVGPDIVYHEGVWFAVTDHGTFEPFHEGPILDFSQYGGGVSVEALQFELLSGTPLFGTGLPADWGLRLDGGLGALVDANGTPVDLSTFDPWAEDAPTDGDDPATDAEASDGDVFELDVDFGAGAPEEADTPSEATDPDGASPREPSDDEHLDSSRSPEEVLSPTARDGADLDGPFDDLGVEQLVDTTMSTQDDAEPSDPAVHPISADDTCG